MSSFVIRIARTLSQGSEGLTPRRSASLDEDGVFPQQPVLRRLSMSPSFNDFSLSVQEDGRGMEGLCDCVGVGMFGVTRQYCSCRPLEVAAQTLNSGTRCRCPRLSCLLSQTPTARASGPARGGGGLMSYQSASDA